MARVAGSAYPVRKKRTVCAAEHSQPRLHCVSTLDAGRRREAAAMAAIVSGGVRMIRAPFCLMENDVPNATSRYGVSSVPCKARRTAHRTPMCRDSLLGLDSATGMSEIYTSCSALAAAIFRPAQISAAATGTGSEAHSPVFDGVNRCHAHLVPNEVHISAGVYA